MYLINAMYGAIPSHDTSVWLSEAPFHTEPIWCGPVMPRHCCERHRGAVGLHNCYASDGSGGGSSTESTVYKLLSQRGGMVRLWRLVNMFVCVTRNHEILKQVAAVITYVHELLTFQTEDEIICCITRDAIYVNAILLHCLQGAAHWAFKNVILESYTVVLLVTPLLIVEHQLFVWNHTVLQWE